MDVVFVNFVSNGPPFNSGIAALSAFLKKHAKTTALISVDSETSGQEMETTLAAMNPRIVAFSIHTPHWGPMSELFGRVRRATDALIVCGGYHPTLCPEEVIGHPDVDVVCRGEGERPLLELSRCVDSGEDFSRIPGLWVKKRSAGSDVTILRNPVPTPEDLEELPYWDREIFTEAGIAPERFSLSHIGGFPLASGRGCPFSCNFCNNSSILRMYKESEAAHHGYVRKRSVENVIGECVHLMNVYGAQRFEFWDEMFASDRDWVNRFCTAYEREVNKPFVCALRVERADETTLNSLASAGCKCIFFGVETGNEEYRKNYLNRKMSNGSIETAFARARDAGLQRFAWVMFGLPDETPALVEETIAFLHRLKPDIIGWSVYHPLPGTQLYDYCREKGYLVTENIFPYENAPDYAVPAIRQPSISIDEIKRFCNRFREMEQEGFLTNK